MVTGREPLLSCWTAGSPGDGSNVSGRPRQTEGLGIFYLPENGEGEAKEIN